ncbi:hypothetical protein QOZ80_2AG0131680 [Eleusine coracana subsp. coracana]|nr:hypothetical protein QOZ80_2AG0131680 [Eleusine coracana subsp. coracana]
MLMTRDVDESAADQVTNKIRKRCALSSSSSEPRRTRRRLLRLKRTVRLIGRRTAGGALSPCKTGGGRRMSESSWNGHRHRRRLAGVDTRPTSAASARKLVSALWQLDNGVDACEGEGEVGWDAAAARRSSDHHRRSASLELSKLSRRKSKALEGDGDRSWHNGHAHGHWFSDVISSNGGTMEAARGLASPCLGPGDRMAQLQELYNSMTASKELVRILSTVLPPGALNPTSASLLTALRSELDVARARARQLARDQMRRCHVAAGGEQMREEMRAWKSRHREKSAAAARVVASELDAERRARRRAERVGARLGEALAEAEAALRGARRDAERERRARERAEKACDELALAAAAGGPVEEEEEEVMRRREELEREREMLRVADEMREERVRMKLAEARVQFEEKNAVVDSLRQELEAFLGRGDGQGDSSPPGHPHHDDAAVAAHRLQLVLASDESVVNGINSVAVHKHTRKNGGENDDDGSSDGSDIELNVDGNSRDYSWSYGTAASNKETMAAAASRSSRHGSFSDRGTEGADRQGVGEQHWNQGCISDDDEEDDRTTAKEDMDEDAERYEAIKNLREQMLAGHGFVFLSQQQQGGPPDAGDRDHRRRPGFVCHQVEDGGVW